MWETGLFKLTITFPDGKCFEDSLLTRILTQNPDI